MIHVILSKAKDLPDVKTKEKSLADAQDDILFCYLFRNCCFMLNTGIFSDNI